MPLSNLIDLIAEVAAKRVTQRAEQEDESPQSNVFTLTRIPALLRQLQEVFAMRPHWRRIADVWLARTPRQPQ